ACGPAIPALARSGRSDQGQARSDGTRRWRGSTPDGGDRARKGGVEMAGGIMKPDLFEIRLQADKRMIVGRMDNRRRDMEIGGLGNPGRGSEGNRPHTH